MTHTFPLDFAAAISGLEAVPPAGAAEADFLAVLLVDEPAAGAAGAAAELAAGVDEVAAGVEVVFAAAEDFLLAFALDESDGLAIGVEAVGCVVSALADFFDLLLLVALVADAPAGADAALESVLDDFLLPFFEVVLSDDVEIAEDEL